MKKTLLVIILLIGVRSYGANVTAFNMDFKPFAGGSQTEVSWNFVGDTGVTDGPTYVSGFSMNMVDEKIINRNGTIVDNTRDFSFNNAGSFTNITTSQTSQIDGMSIASYSYYGDVVYESISLNSPSYVTGWNNTIQYVSGVDNYIIDTLFSNFNYRV
jgi:hypothetical protein